ncbi:phage tail protein [Pasteurella multocida]|uniref:phage tail protein n=1 Tax=Pasteurella multocida TaxID=747 RepID=UPI002B7BC2CA|nr:phage tail protein [Pasteurella multocida]MEB3457129.1 phage tail protein [Pasteurella multocida]
MKIKLPFWMDKGELSKIAQLFEKWWVYVLSAVKFPFNILNEETCGEKILNLIAYQRDVERFDGEPIELFRKRVKYAFLNAKDAGSKAGFIRIFERLGIGYVEITERFDVENWDVIKIHLSDSQLAKNHELLNLIIRKYGRTCRRYTFEVISKKEVTIQHGEFDHDYECHYIKIN